MAEKEPAGSQVLLVWLAAAPDPAAFLICQSSESMVFTRLRRVRIEHAEGQ